MFDDTYDATLFDPNPWGARQRVLPPPTFIAAAPIASPPIRETVPVYAAPILEASSMLHAISRLVVPLIGVVVLLAIAYAMKPTSSDVVVPALAIASSPEAIQIESIQIELEPIAPAAAAVAIEKKRTPRAVKRRPVRIDMTDTASPLGRMRPGKAR